MVKSHRAIFKHRCNRCNALFLTQKEKSAHECKIFGLRCIECNAVYSDLDAYKKHVSVCNG